MVVKWFPFLTMTFCVSADWALDQSLLNRCVLSMRHGRRSTHSFVVTVMHLFQLMSPTRAECSVLAVSFARVSDMNALGQRGTPFRFVVLFSMKTYSHVMGQLLTCAAKDASVCCLALSLPEPPQQTPPQQSPPQQSPPEPLLRLARLHLGAHRIQLYSV